jgi:hypothetical protein
MTTSEATMHINCLELLAAWLGLKAICANESEKHIRVMVDNQTAVCYIRELGGSKSPE